MALTAPHRRFSIFRYRLKIIAVAGGSLGVPLLVVVLYLFTDLFFTPPPHVASRPESGDWAMFGRDLAHTGAGELHAPEPRGTIKWTFPTGAPIHSSPAVAGGMVYFGSQDSTLYALDATTGRQIWQFRAESLIRTSPAVVDGVLYFGAHDGSIRALDAATGEQLWSYRAKYAITSSPAVADGRVYVGTTAKRLLALEAATGRRKWSATLVGQVHSSPAVANGLVYIGVHGENSSIACMLATGASGRGSAPVATLPPRPRWTARRCTSPPPPAGSTRSTVPGADCRWSTESGGCC